MINNKKYILFAFLLLFLLSNASALTIFSDDFEDGDLAGWSLTTQSGANAWGNVNTDPNQGFRHAQAQPSSTSEPASVMERTISTLGYQNITLNYSRKLIGIDAADEFQVEFNTGSGWNILEQTAGNAVDDTSYVLKNFTFSSAANNNSAFQIKFECTAGAVSEYCRVDDIIVSGNLIDTIPPQFSNFVENPINASAYIPGQNYSFNVTITDNINIANAGIEFNGINRSLTNTSSVYKFNITNLAAGTYSYYYWANDSNRNYNSSERRYFSITKATPTITKLLNGISNNISIQYPQQINASGSTNAGTFSIYREGILINNGQNYTLGAGYYRFDFNVTGNQNYTNYSESLYLNLSKTSGEASLLFNGISNNISIQYPQQINASGSTLYGTITLFRNGLDVTSENGLNVTLGAGYYNYTLISSGDQNHSSAIKAYFVNITRANSQTSLYLNNSRANISIYEGSTIPINSSVNTQEGIVNVYSNNVIIYSGSSPSYNLTNFTTIGTYNITAIFTGSQNYSISSETWYVNASEKPDVIFPLITIHTPENKTYGTNDVFLNYSVSDNKGIGICKYSLDNSPNQSLPSCGTTTISGLSDGNHEIKVYVNDTSGNLNHSSVIFNIDNSAPSYSNVQTNTPASYNNNYSYFNLTWNDANLQSVILESNFSGENRNYSMQNLGNGKYSLNQTLPAGTFYWISYANDSFGHMSSSNLVVFTIQKSNSGLTLYLNGNQNNLTLIYGTKINASAISVDNNFNLYRNTIDITSENGLNVTLGAGYYNYTAYFAGNQNYSEKSITFFLNVTKATPQLELLLNGFDSDVSTNVFLNLIINASSIFPENENVALYEDGILISSGTSLNEIKNYSLTGQHKFNVTINETQNYTASSKSHIVTILDANYPSFSNIVNTPLSPTTHAYVRSYQFNSTWVDNVGIEDVIFNFNNYNYSYSSLDIGKNGDEYYISVNNLPAGIYQYKWYANDSSGNLVETPTQTYTINQQITAIFLSMSPSNTISYGTGMSVGCVANNAESIINMERNTNPVTNPDTEILAPEIYSYSCISAATQNFTSASSTGTLTITKANPEIELLLNGIEGDITLPVGGGFVNVIANLTLLYNVDANLTLIVDNIENISGINFVENNFTFSSGSHNISIYYRGNQNYSSFTLNRYVVVQSPQPPNSGGSSGGGGGGGGGSTVIIREESNKSIELEFQSLGDVIMSPGESKILELSAKNIGGVFLNKCSLSGKKNYSDWFESKEIANINPGEISEYIFEINAPLSANQNDNPSLQLECLEKTFDIPIKVIILQSGMNIQIDNMNLIKDNELEVNYSIIGNNDFSEELLFQVFDSNEKLLSEKIEGVEIRSGKSEKSIILDVSKAEKGLLKITISKVSDRKIIVDEFFVYDSSQPITGLAFLDKVNKSSFYTVIILIIFALIAFMTIRRMISIDKVKRWANTHKDNDKMKIVEKWQKVADKKIVDKSFNLNKEKHSGESQIEKEVKEEPEKNNSSFEVYDKGKSNWETY